MHSKVSVASYVQLVLCMYKKFKKVAPLPLWVICMNLLMLVCIYRNQPLDVRMTHQPVLHLEGSFSVWQLFGMKNRYFYNCMVLFIKLFWQNFNLQYFAKSTNKSFPQNFCMIIQYALPVFYMHIYTACSLMGQCVTCSTQHAPSHSLPHCPRKVLIISWS